MIQGNGFLIIMPRKDDKERFLKYQRRFLRYAEMDLLSGSFRCKPIVRWHDQSQMKNVSICWAENKTAAGYRPGPVMPSAVDGASLGKLKMVS